MQCMRPKLSAFCLFEKAKAWLSGVAEAVVGEVKAHLVALLVVTCPVGLVSSTLHVRLRRTPSDSYKICT